MNQLPSQQQKPFKYTNGPHPGRGRNPGYSENITQEESQGLNENYKHHQNFYQQMQAPTSSATYQ